MYLSCQIQYQPRTCASHAHVIAYCNESQTSKRVVILREEKGKYVEHNLDIYDNNLAELRFLSFKDYVAINLLTQTTVKGYSLEGATLYSFEREVEGDIAQFDKFVSSTVLGNTLYTLSQKGKICQLKDKVSEPVSQVEGRGIVMSAIKNMLIVSTEDNKIWKIENNVPSELVKLQIKLPVYFIETLSDETLVLGTISGELLIGSFSKNIFNITCSLQAHVGILTSLKVTDNTILTGSDDGFVNMFTFHNDKLSLTRSRNMARIITGIFIVSYKYFCSLYQQSQLHPI